MQQLHLVRYSAFWIPITSRQHYFLVDADIYRVVSDMDDTVPLGAPLYITFRFNGEGITTISPSTQFEFYPLFHIPAIELSIIRFDRQLQEVSVGYNQVTPSLSGQYVLCQEAGPPPSARRKRGVDQSETRPRICGGRVTLTVTGTLLISDKLFINNYVILLDLFVLPIRFTYYAHTTG